MDYAHKNSLYHAARLKRLKALDLYEGGLRVEKREDYLVRHPFETEKQYAIRLERSAYRNLAAPIVDVFASYICDKRPTRTLPKILEPMLANVDRRNTAADVFFANQVRLAAAGGVSFVLCDMEPAKGDTLAEDRQAGRYGLPYFVPIDPDDVWDWRCDERGIAWCVLHSVETLPGEPFAERVGRDILTVWTRDSWRRYSSAPRILDENEDSLGLQGEMAIEAEGSHPLGEPPLVPLLFEPVTPMTGNPVTDDVLSLILRVYRRDSELDKMLFDCAVPLAIINGLEVDQKESFIRSSSNVLVSSSMNGIQGSYMEPGGISFNALRESLDNDLQSIREIALRMVRPQSGVGESAESKSIDKQQLDTQLASFARRSANSERKCFELAYKWLTGGADISQEELQTPYNEDYSIGEMEKLDRAYLMEMYNSGAISRASYLELLQKLGVIGEDFDIEGESARIELQAKGGEGPSGVERTGKSLLDMASKVEP